MISTTLRYLDAHQLKAWIHDAEELALLDVREHGQYGENHLFFAVPLPYSDLELNVLRLVPRKATRIAIYGDVRTHGAVLAAGQALLRMGYDNVHVLEGGIDAWQKAGYATFAGVNLPSKTFGELAEHVYNTPSVSAAKLRDMLADERENIIVLDGRPVPEYQKMSIPGAYCCPNGELALRARELAPDPDTTIVINCAGRTRSIIGAQTLINLNVPNKVLALENGTQGWYLEDYPLEHGSSRLYPERVSETSKVAQREQAIKLTEKLKIQTVDARQVTQWLDEDTYTVFLCDVRTDEEYALGELPSLVQHTPGGQLIQATDQYLGVRKAKVVLCDTDGIRAPAVASWLKQLGWNVFLLTDPSALTGLPEAPRFVPAIERTKQLPADALAGFLHDYPQAILLDARSSTAYRAVCLKQAAWTIRPMLAAQIHEQLGLPMQDGQAQDQDVRAMLDVHGHREGDDQGQRQGRGDGQGQDQGQADRPVLLLGSSIGKLMLLAQDLERMGCTAVYVCVVDALALKASGLPIVENDDILPDEACIDYLFFVHDRHDGNKEAARKYLEWETNLVSQIDDQERNTFSIGF